MRDNQNPPLQALVFGELSAAEHEKLMRGAVLDQELFDDVWEALEQRESIERPGVRSRLLGALGSPVQRRAPFAWNAVWSLNGAMAAAGLAVIAAAVLLWPGREGPRGDHPQFTVATIVTDVTSNPASFFELPVGGPPGAVLDWSPQHRLFHPGEVVRVNLRLEKAASVFVLRRRRDGQTKIVFPPDISTSADLKAGLTPIALDPIAPTDSVDGHEAVALRIITLPPRRDLRIEAIHWTDLRGLYTVQEWHYDVAP
jgi:hypothetical protein